MITMQFSIIINTFDEHINNSLAWVLEIWIKVHKTPKLLIWPNADRIYRFFILPNLT